MNDLCMSILELLQKDARTSPSQMAVMLGVSEAEVQQAIQWMEAEDVLLKYTVIVNEEKVGWEEENVRALIEVRLTPQRDVGFDAISARIARFDEVRTMYLVSGTYDLLAIVDGGSIREISEFVARKLSPIEGVLGTTTHFMLKKYKDQGVCLAGDQVDNRLKVTP